MGRDIKKWNASTQEEVIDPERKIIDTHHHLWKPAKEPRGQVVLAAKLLQFTSPTVTEFLFTTLFPASTLAFFSKYNYACQKYTFEDLKKDFGGHNVVATVEIESGWHDKKVGAELSNLGETVQTAKASKEHDFLIASAPFIDLTLGKEKITKAIKAHKEVNPAFASIRHQLAKSTPKCTEIYEKANLKMIYSAPDAKGKNLTLDNPKFVEGLETLAENDIALEVWCYFFQLGEIMDIAAKLPQLNLILNHIGTPLGDEVLPTEPMMEFWKASITSLGKSKNIWVKFSGLAIPGTGIGKFTTMKKAPSSDDLVTAFQPYFDHVLQSFDTNRIMFGSNFPVDKASCSYVILFNSFKKLANAANLPEEDKHKLFFANAAQIYKLQAFL